MADPPYTTPPLEALRDESREVHASELQDVPPDEFHFHLDGQRYYIRPRLPMVTWRHKVYWFLRKLIDWVHP